MSGDLDNEWQNYTTSNTTVAATVPALHPPRPVEVMLPYGFIALLLAVCLVLVGLRNLRLRHPETRTGLKERVLTNPDLPNDLGDEDEFLNNKGNDNV